MQQRIVVPLDGSSAAEAVLPHALALASATAHTLTLLSVVPCPPRSALARSSPEQSMPDHAAEIRQRYAYLCQVALRWQTEDIEISCEVVGGDPAVEVAAYADWHPYVATIVMATHARSGVSRLIFGSVAERVIETVAKPILLVRAQPEASLVMRPPVYRTLLVPLDGSRVAEHALEQALTLAQDTGARLVLLTVLRDVPAPALSLSEAFVVSTGYLPQTHAVERQLDIEWHDQYLGYHVDRLRAAGVPVTSLRSHGDPAGEIRAAAAREHADLILMTTHGRQGPLSYWQADVARRVLHEAHVPILFVRVPREQKE